MTRFLNYLGSTAVLMFLSACTSQQLPSETKTDNIRAAIKPYRLTYLVPSGNVMTEQHQYFDGVGRLRIETGGKGSIPKMVTVYDCNRKEVLSWTDGSGRYTRRTMTEQDFTTAQRPVTTSGAQPVGTKEIDGHKCHGWRTVTANGLVCETWIDDEFGCMIESTTGGATIELSEFSTEPPAALLFEVPAQSTETKNR